ALAPPADTMHRLGPKRDVLFAGTFAGHTLHVSAALACTNVVLDGALHDHLPRLRSRLTAGAQAAVAAAGVAARGLENARGWTGRPPGRERIATGCSSGGSTSTPTTWSGAS